MYFSKKNESDVINLEFSVLPNGHAMYTNNHRPGSVHDIQIMGENTFFHIGALKGPDIFDHGSDSEHFIDVHPRMHTLMADKGYQGISEILRLARIFRIHLLLRMNRDST